MAKSVFDIIEGVVIRDTMKRMVIYYLNIAKSKNPEMYADLAYLHLVPSAHQHRLAFQGAIAELAKLTPDELEKMQIPAQFRPFWSTLFGDLPGFLAQYFENERATLTTPEHGLLLTGRALQIANDLGRLIAEETAAHSVEDLLNRMGIKVRDDDPR